MSAARPVLDVEANSPALRFVRYAGVLVAPLDDGRGGLLILGHWPDERVRAVLAAYAAVTRWRVPAGRLVVTRALVADEGSPLPAPVILVQVRRPRPYAVAGGAR